MKASRITLAELSTRVTRSVISLAVSLPAFDSLLVRCATKSGLLSRPMASLASVRDNETTVGRTTSPFDALKARIH